MKVMNMQNSRLWQEKGFTILEVVFAVSILAIGIMGYTSLKISNRYSWVFAKDLTQAVPFTNTQWEGMLLGGYDGDAMGGPNLSGMPGKTYTNTITAANYAVNSGAFGDVLGVGDVSVGGSNWLNWHGVTTPGGTPTEKTFVDFSPSQVSWTVYGECPSELAKMVIITTLWGNGSRTMNITQAQVRNEN